MRLTIANSIKTHILHLKHEHCKFIESKICQKREKQY